jgi:RNA polymerase sigma-70 factor (ECF subfamily)
MDDEVDARMLVERFRKESLPEKYLPVFEARFIRQLPQREAAASLSMQRSTLAYQEERIRTLLRDFLLESEAP